MSDHGQPIHEWAEKQKGITAEDRAAILALPGVRTVGDLETVLARGEIGKELATKLRQVLK